MPCATLETAIIRSASTLGESGMAKHSKHTWVVDVIEESSASIEVDGRSVTPIPVWLLPEGVKEGDGLSVTHDRGEGKSRTSHRNRSGRQEKSARQIGEASIEEIKERSRWRYPALT